jgi:tetratricopeptide (TPR) repeat protein
VNIDYSVRRSLEAASNLMMQADHGAAGDAYLKAAELYASVGRANEALALAFTALQIAPSRFVALAVSGLLRSLGPHGLPLCKRAIELHLDHRRTHDAVALLEVLVVVEPRDAEVRIQLAELYARTGRREAGLAIETAALALFEADGNNRDVLAVAGHMLSLDARHIGALRALIAAHHRLGEIDRAMRHAATLLTLHPRDPVAMEAVARTLIARGDARRCIEVLMRLVGRLGEAEAEHLLHRARRWSRDPEYAAALDQLHPDAVIELSGEDLLPLTA